MVPNNFEETATRFVQRELQPLAGHPNRLRGWIRYASTDAAER